MLSVLAITFAVGLAALGCSGVRADSGTPLAIVRVWTGYRDALSFARFGAFPAEDAEPGGAIVVRSQPDQRAGFYFSIRVNGTERRTTVPAGRLVLHVVAPDAAAPQSFTFPFEAGGARSVLLLAGLTGSDWPYGEALPLAWKLEIIDASGNVLAARESFLWSQS